MNLKKPLFNYAKLTLLVLGMFQFTACGSVEQRTVVQDEVTTPDNNETLQNVPKTPTVDVNKSIDIDNFINDNNCDQVLEKEFSTGYLLSICYDYGYKSAKYVAYTLEANFVNSVNLTDRPYFYTDPEIPKEYQIYYGDYTNSGYDRGHLAPDASFDYNEEDLKIIYTLANIIPQDPNVNRYFWSDAEQRERDNARRLGEINVINGIVFKNPIYIGDHEIAVATAFWKIMWNEDENFRECYYYNNFVLGDADLDTLAKHKVDCDSLILGE